MNQKKKSFKDNITFPISIFVLSIQYFNSMKVKVHRNNNMEVKYMYYVQKTAIVIRTKKKVLLKNTFA